MTLFIIGMLTFNGRKTMMCNIHIYNSSAFYTFFKIFIFEELIVSKNLYRSIPHNISILLLLRRSSFRVYIIYEIVITSASLHKKLFIILCIHCTECFGVFGPHSNPPLLNTLNI